MLDTYGGTSGRLSKRVGAAASLADSCIAVLTDAMMARRRRRTWRAIAKVGARPCKADSSSLKLDMASARISAEFLRCIIKQIEGIRVTTMWKAAIKRKKR